jgi:hypothetical protein
MLRNRSITQSALLQADRLSDGQIDIEEISAIESKDTLFPDIEWRYWRNP